MIVYKCKMCNGNLDMSTPKKLVKCSYCDTYQTVPSVIDENKADMVNRANKYRQNGEFDRAMSIYEMISREDATDPEIHWSIVLCKFGVEYVEDPATGHMVPTINRTQAHSILQDSDYQNAIDIAEPDAKQYYMTEADKIDKIQRSIWRIAQDSEDYDVFISYKELGPDGQRTNSSMIAQRLYEQLTLSGIKTFFSRISLADKIGNEFEPYIFSAINSSKVMLVLGTNKDEFNAPWVKNEWSRFRKLAMTDSHKRLIPCVREITIEDLPDELQPFQAKDMNKEGYEQEILEIVKELVLKLKASESVLKETDAEKLMKNGETYIVLKDFETAEMIFRDLCVKEPEDYRVWWGRIRSVTKDLTDTDAMKKHSGDLKIWMDFIKKLAPGQIYSELVGKYVTYLKKISKQSAIEEIQTVKKIREQACERTKELENEIQDQPVEALEAYRKQDELCYKLDEELKTAMRAIDYANDKKKNIELFMNIFGKAAPLIAGVAYFVVCWFLGKIGGFVVALLLVAVCCIVVLSIDTNTDAFDASIERNEAIIEDTEKKLKKAKVNLEIIRNKHERKKDDLRNVILKYKDVVENADRYLTYEIDAISSLLYAIRCSEIGEKISMNQDMFQIREHTFQTVE